MKFPVYFADEDGAIHTIFNEQDSTVRSNKSMRIVGDRVQFGKCWKMHGYIDEFSVEEEYVLWSSLVGLAETIEGKQCAVSNN